MAKRFKIWSAALETIVGTPSQESRLFPYSIKQQLFEGNPTCKLCNQQIQTIDDAEVDHIIPYSQGGKTESENAQLTHRYCNRKKSNHTE